MGVSVPGTKFLCAAKSLGVDFTSTATIGRQSFGPDAISLRRTFEILGIKEDPDEFLRDNDYSEAFFNLLGAKEVSSIDYSAYERADIVHDMNSPIPEDLRQRFSHVHDGGSIEHVFNVPQAFKNCMEMVQVGGHFTQVNCANNFMGHGFWQFSVELLYRVFSPENGYQVQALVLHEVIPRGRWFMVVDPAAVRRRVALCNSVPTAICTIAKRISDNEVFSKPPLQSDYVATWDSQTKSQLESAAELVSNDHGRPSLKQVVKSWVPAPVKRALQHVRRGFTPAASSSEFDQSCYYEIRKAIKLRRQGGFDPNHYKEIDEDTLLRGRLRADGDMKPGD